jgi:hypothetical protein
LWCSEEDEVEDGEQSGLLKKRTGKRWNVGLVRVLGIGYMKGRRGRDIQSCSICGVPYPDDMSLRRKGESRNAMIAVNDRLEQLVSLRTTYGSSARIQSVLAGISTRAVLRQCRGLPVDHPRLEDDDTAQCTDRGCGSLL